MNNVPVKVPGIDSTLILGSFKEGLVRRLLKKMTIGGLDGSAG